MQERSDQLDCIVIGAGVVGLAIGRSLALARREVVVLEAEPEIGMHTSSRNSEVIHAGLYYPGDSLKARLCVAGKQMLYDYCEAHPVSVNRIGKLIVASTEKEIGRLQTIKAQAERNGVHDLTFLTAKDLNALEPDVVCDVALLSPSTGIIDSHALMLSLQGEIEGQGGAVLTRSRVESIAVTDSGFAAQLDGDAVHCSTLINSAGLFAADLSHRIDGMPRHLVPEVHFAVGHYFTYQGRSPFRHLVYPVPTDGGLGIHATNDMGGSTRFGPDVEWIHKIDYDFDDSRKGRFVKAIRQYFPGLDDAKLVPAYTGIRPKLHGPGQPAQDFMIQCEAQHGVPGLVNLFGIESPGLTACLAIGDYVVKRLANGA